MGVEEQRAKSLDDIPNLPTVRLTMDMEIFSSLGYGRIQLDEVQAKNGVRIEGDRPLGQKILEEMNIFGVSPVLEFQSQRRLLRRHLEATP